MISGNIGRLNTLTLVPTPLLVAVLLAACFIFVPTTCLASDKNIPRLMPALVCKQITFNSGPVEEGMVIKHSFTLTNVGRKPLTLTRASASCGCTVAKLRTNNLPPGASTLLDVTLNTSLKFGTIDRQITVVSDDPVRPMLVLHIAGTINNPHKDMRTAADRAKIFKGSCAVCHANKGIGKMGKALYLADCAICHGAQAQGGFASSLQPVHLSDDLTVKRTISYGSEVTPSMPGFLKAHGGPLSERQIDSIIRYLKNGNDHPHN